MEFWRGGNGSHSCLADWIYLYTEGWEVGLYKAKEGETLTQLLAVVYLRLSWGVKGEK